MKILKTALLSSALMGAIFGSNEALLNPDEIAIEKKADSEYFAETLKKLEEENNKNLEIIKKIAAKAVGGKNIEVDAKKGPALTYLGALYTRIISLLEANKELVAEHNTQKAQLEDQTKAKQSLENKIADVEKELETLKAAKKSTDKELIAKTKQLDEEKDRAAGLEKEYNQAVDREKSTIEDTGLRIKNILKDVTDSNKNVSLLTAEVAKLEATNNSLKEQLDREKSALRMIVETIKAESSARQEHQDDFLRMLDEDDNSTKKENNSK